MRNYLTALLALSLPVTALAQAPQAGAGQSQRDAFRQQMQQKMEQRQEMIQDIKQKVGDLRQAIAQDLESQFDQLRDPDAPDLTPQRNAARSRRDAARAAYDMAVQQLGVVQVQLDDQRTARGERVDVAAVADPERHAHRAPRSLSARSKSSP